MSPDELRERLLEWMGGPVDLIIDMHDWQEGCEIRWDEPYARDKPFRFFAPTYLSAVGDVLEFLASTRDDNE